MGKRYKPIPPDFTNAGSPFTFIGEAPGKNEDLKRKYFVGESGRLMDRMCHLVGIPFKSQMLLNVIEERPDDNNIKPFLDLTAKNVYESAEYLMYKDMLVQNIIRANSDIIVPLGGTALYAITGLRQISNFRGYWVDSNIPELKGRKIMPMYHPASRSYQNRFLTIHDLGKAKRFINKPLPIDNNKYIIKPSYQQAVSFMDYILSNSNPVSFDIETKIPNNNRANTYLSCFSLAYTDRDEHGKQRAVSMSIPLVFQNSQWKMERYFSPAEEQVIMLRLKHILESGRFVLGHNILFDAYAMYELYGIYTANLVDTMVAMAVYWPDQPKGLHVLVSLFTDLPFYKVDELGTKQSKMENNSLWLYNAKDAAVLFQIMSELHKLNSSIKNIETLNRQMKALNPAFFTMCRKLKVDIERLSGFRTPFAESCDKLKTELTAELGGIVPSETKKLTSYFYNYKFYCPTCSKEVIPLYMTEDKCPLCGLNLTKADIIGDPRHKAFTKMIKTKEGKRKSVTLDKRALKAMSDTLPIASKILEYRTKSKSLAVYYDAVLAGPNNDLLPTSINIVGTPNGRFSCSKDLFNRGTNWQNLPNDMRSCIIPSKGHLAAEIDLSQAETVCVAYYAQEPLLMEAIEKCKDIHKRTASLIFNLNEDAPDFPDEARKDGKSANYGLMYGEGAEGFARIYSIPISRAVFIRTRYFQSYPSIFNWQAITFENAKKGLPIINAMGRVRILHRRLDSETHKYLLNQKPQSTVADYCDEFLYEALFYNTDKYPNLVLCNQVHDSIWFEFPIPTNLNEEIQICDEIETFRTNARVQIEWLGRKFFIDNDLMVGHNFGKAKDNNPFGLTKVKKLTPELLRTIIDKKK